MGGESFLQWGMNEKPRIDGNPFELARFPENRGLQEFELQLFTVAQRAGTVLDRLGMEDFDAFCRQVYTPQLPVSNCILCNSD